MAQRKKVVIVGGGAAGFFTAANIDESKFDVTILEQNSDVLQKVKISGGGRCNVTHACFDPRDLVQFYPRGSRELRSVFHQFQPGDTMQWFEERGVSLKIENDNRVFPESNSSQNIINLLKKEVEDKGFRVLTKKSVASISLIDDVYSIEAKDETFTADFVVFATGSSPKSLELLRNLGHTIVEAVPSLFTFNIKDALLEDLPGTSFSAATVRLPKLKLEENGPLLITHWGLSGPAVLRLSAWGARQLSAVQYKTSVLVNFIGIDLQAAEELLSDAKLNHPKKTIGQTKIFDVTNRFWNKLLTISGVDPSKQLAHLTAKETKKLLDSLCEYHFEMNGKSTFKEEFVTAGGVELKEINFKNMESKLLPRLYIAGEVLDIDAITGGFNFQACWSEAWIIAQDLNAKS